MNLFSRRAAVITLAVTVTVIVLPEAASALWGLVEGRPLSVIAPARGLESDSVDRSPTLDDDPSARPPLRPPTVRRR
jgi:hypothetical protein